jgi:membrane-anchored protein YejM (alkaline phosphatase superfamily)
VVTGLISDIHSITNCETTVIVTADHGEDLGDSPLDSSFGHTGSLSEGLLHVPLELYNPPQGYKSVYDNLVSHLDLAQLIMSIADESDCDISRTVAPAEIIGGLRMDQD